MELTCRSTALREAISQPLSSRALTRTFEISPLPGLVELLNSLEGREHLGTEGAFLMERIDPELPGGSRAVLFPSPLLRLTFRDGRLELTGLQPRAKPLLERFQRLRGGRLEEAPGNHAQRVTKEIQPSVGNPSEPDEKRLLAPSILSEIRAIATLVEDEDPVSNDTRASITVAGAFGYELIDHFERLPGRRPDPLEEPDLNLVLCLDAIVLEPTSESAGRVTVMTRGFLNDPFTASSSEDREETRARERLEALCRGVVDASRNRVDVPRGEPIPKRTREPSIDSDLSESEFRFGVRRIQELIRRGDLFQCVLSRSLRAVSEASSLEVYRALRDENPSPYHFHFDLGDGALLGASPETFLQVEGNRVLLNPIAGTAPRGEEEGNGALQREVDARLAIGLLLDPKEQAEHAMLIDLARNDVSRVCDPSRTAVETPFTIEKFRCVQHLVTRVTGTLREECDALDAYRASANPGTLTGAPKLRAMETLRDLEATARGYYGGAVGVLSSDGDFDCCIAIRSLRERNGTYTVRSGAGIVAESEEGGELEETLRKARGPLLAIAAAERRGS